MVWNILKRDSNNTVQNARTKYHSIDNKSSLHPKLEAYYHLYNVMRNDVFPVSGGVKILVCTKLG